MTLLLIVDGDADHARALSRNFAELHSALTVLSASTVAQAMAVLQERTVDLLLAELQIPEMDGFELLAWAIERCPDTSLFAMSESLSELDAARLKALAAIEYFPKPLEARLAIQRFAEYVSQSIRGHLQNVSLASMLQVLEMERKTCAIAVTCEDKRGTLVVRRGVLVHARYGETSGQAAAIAIVAWPNPSITISTSRDAEPASIAQSLGFIVMEAMRVQDEAARGGGEPGSAWPLPRRTWRPSGVSDSNLPPPPDLPSRVNGEPGLPSGARMLAVVATSTGEVLRYMASNGCPVNELASMASQVLQHEIRTLRLCDAAEGLEELVLSTTSRCDVIRPLGASEFALLVFAPEETNLVMARLELEHFLVSTKQTAQN
jgi:CheY-like chemotaxis protein